MLNNVNLIGRLTRDPELRKTQSGTSVLSFTLAVNRKFNKEEQDADFINCVAWKQTADFMSNYLTKGALISVEGRIQTRNYEKDGQRIYVTEVVAEGVQSLESKAQREANGTNTNYQSQSNNQGYYGDKNVEEEFGGPTLDINSDDLPF